MKYPLRRTPINIGKRELLHESDNDMQLSRTNLIIPEMKGNTFFLLLLVPLCCILHNPCEAMVLHVKTKDIVCCILTPQDLTDIRIKFVSVALSITSVEVVHTSRTHHLWCIIREKQGREANYHFLPCSLLLKSLCIGWLHSITLFPLFCWEEAYNHSQDTNP